MSGERRMLNVGLVGYAFMGRAHAHAWRTAARFFDLPLEPRVVSVCGRDRVAVASAAAQFDIDDSTTDWLELVHRDDIDIIDICTPGSSHAEIAIAALDAGKHVLCEKPLANTAGEAEAMVAAAERADERGVRSMVGFSYRRVPALALAARLIAGGRIGRVREVRARYLQDWLVDPRAPMSWRLDRNLAGSGTVGDLGAHLIDMTQYLIGDDVVEVSGRLTTFTEQRPVGVAPDAAMAAVTVDDSAVFLARFGSGVLGTFETSRVAAGRRNGLTLEIGGSSGTVAFDLERMNELQLFDGTDDPVVGFQRIQVTGEGQPYGEAWWPVGHGLGYDHTFVNQAADFARAIGMGERPLPTFRDGLQVQRVVDAVIDSAGQREWITVPGRA